VDYGGCSWHGDEKINKSLPSLAVEHLSDSKSVIILSDIPDDGDD
jgi:hypothetical protein